METDDKLIEYYIDGFNDELNGTFMQGISLSEMAEKAYYLGGLHAVLGDDVKSVDNINRVDILKMIR